MAKNINVVLTLQDRFTNRMTAARYETLKFKTTLAGAQVVSDKFAGIMHKMEKTAAVGVTVAGTATAAMVKSSLNAYKDLNKSLNEVAGIKGISTASDEMKQLTQSCKEASKSVKGTTYKDAADTLKYMTLAGWSTNDCMKKLSDGSTALSSILKAVRINGEDVQQTADAVTDSMTALGLAVEDTAEYIDMCAAVQSSSNTNMLQLNNALIKCGAGMKSLNTPLKDTMSLIGMLSSGGFKDSEAGTILNSLYSRIVKDSAEAQDGLDQIGLSVYDNNGHLKSALELFGQMSQKVKDLNEQERNSAMSKIGGRFRSQLEQIIAGFTEVGEDGQTAFEKIQKSISESKGASDRFIDALGSGWSGSVEKFQSSWKNFCANMGEIMAPYASEALNYITEKLPDIENWVRDKLPTALDKGKNIIIDIKDILNDMKPTIKWVVEHWQQIAIGTGTVYGGMGAVRLGTAGMEAYDTISRFTKSKKRMNINLEKAAENWGLKVVNDKGRKVPIDTSPIAGRYEFIKAKGNSEQLKNYGSPYRNSYFDNGIIDLIASVDEKTGKTVLSKSALGLDDISPIFKDGVREGIEETAKSSTKKSSMMGILGGAADTGLSLAGMASSAASTSGAVTGAGATVGSAGGIGGSVIGSAAGGGTALAGAVGLAGLAAVLVGAYKCSEKLRESIKRIGETIKDHVKPTIDNIKDGFNNGLDAAQPLIDVIKGGFKVIGDVITPIIDILNPIIGGFMDIVGMGLKTILEGIGKAFGLIGEAIKKVGEWLNPFIELIKDAWGWLSDMSKEFSDFINKVNKDGGDSGYTPIAYTGDHSMKNGTVGQQSNHSGGISNEAEGKDDEDSGIDMKLNSDGIYVPSYNALGTNYWKGGKTYVNENGGEIMDLPRGTRIIPADKSEKMTAKGNEVKVIVNVENLYGEDEKFINRIGDAIGYKLAKLL